MHLASKLGSSSGLQGSGASQKKPGFCELETHSSLRGSDLNLPMRCAEQQDSWALIRFLGPNASLSLKLEVAQALTANSGWSAAHRKEGVVGGDALLGVQHQHLLQQLHRARHVPQLASKQLPQPVARVPLLRHQVRTA